MVAKHIGAIVLLNAKLVILTTVIIERTYLFLLMQLVHLIIQIVPLNVLAFLATQVIRKLEIYASMALPIVVLEELLEVHVCVVERIQVLLILIHIGVGNEYSSENLKSFYNNKNKALSSERALFYLYFAVAMFVFQ